MAAVVPNLEEASNVATEFIYSIDNLPGEVTHILQEIKHREARTLELQQDIDRETARYIRYSRKATSPSTPMPLTSSTTPSTPIPDSPSASSSRGESVAPQTGNGTQIPIPDKVSASYAEIHELAAEKCVLAEKLIELITRTRAKLDVDIARVRLLQGDPPELVAAQAGATMNMKPAGMMGLAGAAKLPGGLAASVAGGGAESFGALGRNPAFAISESLRNAMAQQTLPDAAAIAAASAGSSASLALYANKKRRTTTTTSIKISPAASPTQHRSASPASGTPASHLHTQQKSRLSRQVHPTTVEDDDMDVDGEGEDEDAEAEDDNEDETLYCFCQKQSYGDMIACDNEGSCPYEWFHLACVGLKQPPAEKWFCSVCVKTKGLTPTPTTSRKGRKK